MLTFLIFMALCVEKLSSGTDVPTTKAAPMADIGGDASYITHITDLPSDILEYIDQFLTTDHPPVVAYFWRVNSLNLPNWVDKIPRAGFSGDGFFQGNIFLLKVDLSNTNLPEIPRACFKDCSNLRRVLLPQEHPVDIRNNAFENCVSLQEVDLRNFKHIGRSSFRNTGLVEVVIPGICDTIWKGAFSNCIKLKSVVIEEGCLGIRRSCFSGCVRLENLQLPDSLRYLGINAVWGCISLHVLRIARGTFPGNQNYITRDNFTSRRINLAAITILYKNNEETKSSSGEFFGWRTYCDNFYQDGTPRHHTYNLRKLVYRPYREYKYWYPTQEDYRKIGYDYDPSRKRWCRREKYSRNGRYEWLD